MFAEHLAECRARVSVFRFPPVAQVSGVPGFELRVLAFCFFVRWLFFSVSFRNLGLVVFLA